MSEWFDQNIHVYVFGKLTQHLDYLVSHFNYLISTCDPDNIELSIFMRDPQHKKTTFGWNETVEPNQLCVCFSYTCNLECHLCYISNVCGSENSQIKHLNAFELFKCSNSFCIIGYILNDMKRNLQFNDQDLNQIVLFYLLLNIFLRCTDHKSGIYVNISRYNAIFPLEGQLPVNINNVEELYKLKLFFHDGLVIRGLYPNQVFHYLTYRFIHVYKESNIQYSPILLNEIRVLLDTIENNNFCVDIYNSPGIVVYQHFINDYDEISMLFKKYTLAPSYLAFVHNDIWYVFYKISRYNGNLNRDIYYIKFDNLVKYDHISAIQLLIIIYEALLSCKYQCVKNYEFLFERFLNVLRRNDINNIVTLYYYYYPESNDIYNGFKCI
jgi:hypothetical protein